MAQLAFAGIGAAIGSGFGGIAALGLSGTAIGWSIGGMVGGLFGPTQKVQGPRLADLKLTASTYGAPIPYVIGHPRIGGQVIWGSDRREISTTTSRRAKGGPKVKSTTFTYEIDLLIKLTCNEMAGIRKIFINGELQWTAASDADFGSINASGDLATRITVYRGADDQLPDPTYESAVGIGNAPAYRGALTIMLEGLQLGNSGQIPNLTFEVLSESVDVVNTDEIDTFSTFAVYVYAHSDGQSTTSVWATEAAAGSDVFGYRTVNAVGEIIQAGTVLLSGYGFDMVGRSDRPVVVVAGANLSNRAYVHFLNGSTAQEFIIPGIAKRYVVSGNTLILSTATTVHRYNILDSQSPLVSAALSADVRNWAVVDGALYGLEALGGTNAKTVRVFDLETLALTDSFSTPIVNGSAEILDGDDGFLYILSTTELYKYEAGAWSLVMTVPTQYGAIAGTGNDEGANPYFVDGTIYTTRSFSAVGNTRVAWPALSSEGIPLDEVVTTLCERAGISSSVVTTSELDEHLVRAYAITPSTSRSVLEVLMQAYHFEAVCAGALSFVSLGGDAAASLNFVDLGTTAPGNFVEPLPLNERNDPEMPAHITIKYMNVVNDFQDGAERSSRIATESDAEQFIELPLGMLPSEAKQAADFSANITQMSLTTASFAVQLKHFNLQPTDVVIVADRDGSTYRVRITKAAWSKGIYQIEAVFDSASAVLSDGLTDEDYEEHNQIRVASATIYVLGDWPLFRDEDDNVGHYWAARGAGDFWPGAALMKSTDDVVYQPVSQIEERGIVGFAVTALGSYAGPNIPDEGNVVRVNIGTGTATSITYEQQITETTGAWMIGAECVIVRVATYVSPGVYDLRGLLRGRKGTEWAIGSHVAGEQVAYIQPAGIRRVGMDLSEVGQSFFYRGVTFGRPLDSSPSRQWANTGVSSKPYAPTNLDAERDANAGTTTILWNRRTRLSEAWWLGNVPLGEEIELWHIYRYTDGTYTTLAEPMVTSTTASYTFAVSGTVYVRIAQVSARVGEGYFLQGAV